MTDKSPLRELFDSVAKANGWSQRDVEKRIEARGEKLSKSRINQLINIYPLASVSSDAIYSLALGLNISPARVAIAAVQSMGFRIHVDDMTPAEAIARDVTLSDDTRRALLAILRGADDGRRGA